MKENSIKNEQSSIEEDIKDLKKYISFSKKHENFSHDADWKWHKEIGEKIERVLKENEVLLKENEELRIKNNAIKRESEAYAEHMIRLDNKLNLEKEKSKYEWIRQNCLPQELVNKLYIPVQKVKDNIEKLKINLVNTQGEELLIYESKIDILQELLEDNHIREKENVNFN